MRCRGSGELISRDLDSRLSAREAVRLHAHLAECPTCATLADDLRRLREATARLRTNHAPPDFAVGVDRRTREIGAARLGARCSVALGRPARWAAAALGALTAIGAATLWNADGGSAGEEADAAAAMVSVGTQVVALSAASPLEDVTVANLTMLSEIEGRSEEQRGD